jgi:Tol biopolymer transport system component/DNA-binding winged helix-turn-helix (wHTH) protein
MERETQVIPVTDARAAPNAYEFAGFRLEPARRALKRPDGTPARLSGKPFDALVYLVEHAGELVDRDELLRSVWPKRVIEDNNLNQAIATLRRVLGEDHVATVAGRGYQFVTPVREVAAPSAHAFAAETVAEPAHEAAGRGGSRSLRWPIFVAAAAAGVAVVALLALTPQRAQHSSLVGARVNVQPLAGYPGEELTPALSPDGTRVAFSWREDDGGRDIYVTQVGVAAPVRLSDGAGADDMNPAWSPDGTRIAFLRHHDPERFDVMVMHALGGDARRMYAGRMYWISVEGSPLLEWTPDGQHLLFTTLRNAENSAEGYGLHRLTLATGRVEDLGLGGGTPFYDTSPAISPDGRWLAFTHYTRGQRLNQVMLQRLDRDFGAVGSPQPVPDLEPGIHHSLHWSSSGDRLWFSNSSQIFEWPLAGTPLVVHTLGPRFSSLTMSIVPRASGAIAAVAVRLGDEDLFAQPVDPVTHSATGDAVVRAPSSGVDYHPRVSPDGRSLAFVSDRTGPRDIWLARVDGTNPRRLTAVGQIIVGYPRWSPDGKTIAFHSSAPGESRLIYRVDVESGVTERLFTGCCPGGWSGDGKALYVTELGNVNYSVRVDLATGERERLVEGETATESADGEFLLYSKSAERGYFQWPLRSASGIRGERRLVDDYSPSRGGLAPVADGFYYIGLTDDSVPRAIRFYDYALGEAKDVAPVPARTAIGLSVTPDGREVLYAAVGGTPEADILLLNLEHTLDD